MASMEHIRTNYLDSLGDQEEWVVSSRNGSNVILNSFSMDEFLPFYFSPHQNRTQYAYFQNRRQYALPNTPKVMILAHQSDSNQNQLLLIQRGQYNFEKLIAHSRQSDNQLHFIYQVFQTAYMLMKKYGFFHITPNMIRASKGPSLLLWFAETQVNNQPTLKCSNQNQMVLSLFDLLQCNFRDVKFFESLKSETQAFHFEQILGKLRKILKIARKSEKSINGLSEEKCCVPNQNFRYQPNTKKKIIESMMDNLLNDASSKSPKINNSSNRISFQRFTKIQRRQNKCEEKEDIKSSEEKTGNNFLFKENSLEQLMICERQIQDHKLRMKNRLLNNNEDKFHLRIDNREKNNHSISKDSESLHLIKLKKIENEGEYSKKRRCTMDMVDHKCVNDFATKLKNNFLEELNHHESLKSRESNLPNFTIEDEEKSQKSEISDAIFAGNKFKSLKKKGSFSSTPFKERNTGTSFLTNENKFSVRSSGKVMNEVSSSTGSSKYQNQLKSTTGTIRTNLTMKTNDGINFFYKNKESGKLNVKISKIIEENTEDNCGTSPYRSPRLLNTQNQSLITQNSIVSPGSELDHEISNLFRSGGGFEKTIPDDSSLFPGMESELNKILFD